MSMNMVQYPVRPPSYKRYAVAITSVGLALLLKSFFVPFIEVESPFLIFFSTVVISAWYGGFEPGILATVLSALLADYFFMQPYYSVTTDPNQLFRIFLFMGEGLVISGLSHTLRRSRDRLVEENLLRRQKEIELAESEERFRLLVEAVPEYAIFALDTAGYIASWNFGAERLKGYRADEIVGKHFSLLYTETDVIQNRPQTILQDATQHGVYTEEGWRVRKDGSQFLAHVVITALKKEGKLCGFSKITRDVTENRASEAEIRRLNAELEQRVLERTAQLSETNKQLEAFTYTVSHDLRAPVRAAQGLSQILMEEYKDRLDEEGQDYLQRICKATNRMEELIQDLLTYSKLSNADLQLRAIDLNGVVEESLIQLQMEIEERAAKINVQKPLLTVEGYRPILIQIVINLLTNAMKYVTPGETPQITIRTERRSDWVRLWVEDKGIGIAPQYREKIFKVFERLDNNYPGTGIGLAIVSRGIERLNGKVGVESEVGEGSRFWVELPEAL